jgi:hypothetical protein
VRWKWESWNRYVEGGAAACAEAGPDAAAPVSLACHRERFFLLDGELPQLLDELPCGML